MKHQQGLPELLVPAGDMEMLETAAVYRADAVYLGGPELNLRAGARGFGFKALPRAIDFARARGMRVYFCLNAYPRQGQLGLVDQYLDQLAEAGPDALIVSDLGVADRARKRVPHIPLHVSTQANTTNSAALAFWREFGARRVNLARETDARALRDILLGRPGLEIEMFVHGAVCMALSGRCLLSAGLNARSANLGLCSQACRFEYRVSSYTVEEKTRPGLDVWEARRLDNDGKFSALFAARDLCLAHYLGWFARLGVSALKIEGRTRSSACLAQVADAYRSALDHLARGCFRPARYLPELVNASTRPMDTGLFRPSGPRLVAQAPAQKRPVLARVLEQTGPDLWRIAVKANWPAGSDVEILCPGLDRPLIKAEEYGLLDVRGNPLDRAHPGVEAGLACGHPGLRPFLFIRAR